jgi:transposase
VEVNQNLPFREVERMMKTQDVILKAMAKKISWLSAAEIVGVTPRTMRRWRERLQEHGYDGLRDRRRGKPSQKRVPLATCEQVLELYQTRYYDFNVKHFHEKLSEEHGIRLGYTWVKRALQGAGLVAGKKKRTAHRKRRPRKEMPGIMLHIDGSKHAWFQDDRYYDLIVILDDATSQIYYAQLVEEESTLTTMAAFREVIETRGLFCASYSDRGSHFFVTRKAGEKADPHRPTQLGRALKELGIKMIAAYSPQARGRSERNFGTWQGRLPQELRLAGITTLEEANCFLRQHYIGEFNRRFTVLAQEKGTALRKCARRDLDLVFSVQTERVVAKDNTVAIGNRWWQIEKCRWKRTLAGQTVTIHQHLDGGVSIYWGPHRVAHFPEGRGNDAPVEAGENQRQVSHRSHRRLETASGASHISTAATIFPLSPKPKAKRVA